MHMSVEKLFDDVNVINTHISLIIDADNKKTILGSSTHSDKDNTGSSPGGTHITPTGVQKETPSIKQPPNSLIPNITDDNSDMPPTVSGHTPVRTPPSVVKCSATPQSPTPATGTPSTRESVRYSSTELYKEY